MTDATGTTRFRLWLWLIRIISVIVLRRMLAERGRLGWADKLDLRRRSIGAF